MTMKLARLVLPILASALFLLTSSVSAQDEEVERLETWPALEKSAQAQLGKEVGRLRKARTPAMGTEAHKALVEAGAAAAPLLLTALGKERKEDARERIEAVLNAVTGPAHTRLLGAEFDAKSAAVRTFCLRRTALLPDPGLRELAEEAWKDVNARAEKKKAEEEELDAAALAVTAAGSLQGLERLLVRCEESWTRMQDSVHIAAQGARGAEATAQVAAWIEGASADRVIAGLRVLAGCGDTESAPSVVRPHLDAEHAQVRVAAINALRGIVDGDPPLEKLSAFEAIERAKRWKARL